MAHGRPHVEKRVWRVAGWKLNQSNKFVLVTLNFSFSGYTKHMYRREAKGGGAKHRTVEGSAPLSPLDAPT